MSEHSGRRVGVGGNVEHTLQLPCGNQTSNHSNEVASARTLVTTIFSQVPYVEKVGGKKGRQPKTTFSFPHHFFPSGSPHLTFFPDKVREQCSRSLWQPFVQAIESYSRQLANGNKAVSFQRFLMEEVGCSCCVEKRMGQPKKKRKHVAVRERTSVGNRLL